MSLGRPFQPLAVHWDKSRRLVIGLSGHARVPLRSSVEAAAQHCILLTRLSETLGSIPDVLNSQFSSRVGQLSFEAPCQCFSRFWC